MQRTRATQQWRVVWPVEAATVLVARHVRHPDRGLVPCPAAPFLAGGLRRAGLAVRYVDLLTPTADEAPPGPGAAPASADPCRDPTAAADPLDPADPRPAPALAATPEPTPAPTLDPRARPSLAVVVSYRARDGRTGGLGAVTRAGGTEEYLLIRELAAWSSVMRTRRLVAAADEPLCQGLRRALVALDRLTVPGGRPAHGLGWPADLPPEYDLRRVDHADLVPDGGLLVLGPAGLAGGHRAAADRARAERRVTVVDTICPLVTRVGEEVRRFAAEGEEVVLVGDPGHAVTPGLLDRAGPGRAHTVTTVADAAELSVADPERIAVVWQPGRAVERAEPVAEALRARFGHVLPQHPASLCHAAGDRERAVRALIDSCDVVLAVGADRVLTELVAAGAETVRLVTGPGDVRWTWLAGAASVGVTAGPAAPRVAVEAVLRALGGLGPCDLTRQHTESRAPSPFPTRREPAFLPAARTPARTAVPAPIRTPVQRSRGADTH
ncbi:hypothetical protein ACN20G_03160 [Streptomyces sp. BI20]|uniref:hypothetical protein n=1 Tax=Streptomyces sp. BI20 TaxID=3403460 RepID=UPI003C770053